MTRTRSFILVAALVTAAVGIGAGVARSQSSLLPDTPLPTTINVYASKFLCGEFDKASMPGQPAYVEGPVKPGNYQTVINLHNPQFSTVNFQKKAVLLFAGDRAVPATEFEVPKPPGQLIPVQLRSDWGMYIDCQDIRKKLLPGSPPAPMFIEGWVVFYSASLIDVETVVTSYTWRFDSAVPGGMSRVGFDTELERVQPTRVSTGVITTQP